MEFGDFIFMIFVVTAVASCVVAGYALLVCGAPYSPHGDPNEVIDNWSDEYKRDKPWRVVFTKVVRDRCWWNAVVCGYYRWLWVADFHAWLIFNLNNGNVRVEKVEA